MKEKNNETKYIELSFLQDWKLIMTSDDTSLVSLESQK